MLPLTAPAKFTCLPMRKRIRPEQQVDWQRTRSLLDCSIHITWPFIQNSSEIVRNHPKFEIFPNISQIQPSLPTSQSFKYCEYQIKHTQFIIIIYIYSKFIPKFNLLIISQSLKYCKNPKINPKFSQMHQKCFPNVSQIQPSLPTSQSFKYCKY